MRRVVAGLLVLAPSCVSVVAALGLLVGDRGSGETQTDYTPVTPSASADVQPACLRRPTQRSRTSTPRSSTGSPAEGNNECATLTVPLDYTKPFYTQ